ncbi:MAG: pyrroloquinoline quinone biosynthesis peptide chaperone PqqD [Pseudomonadota bacterium]|nr:pyrroloquinoline quinone biosynthesis peptide chaperone PqqD [Pseudomonadota bacterium]
MARMIADDSRPRLPRGVRLREDKVRERWVLLAPERVVKVNPIAVEILRLCDGARTLREIVQNLAERFKADPERIASDVRGLLAALADKRMAET